MVSAWQKVADWIKSGVCYNCAKDICKTRRMPLEIPINLQGADQALIELSG